MVTNEVKEKNYNPIRDYLKSCGFGVSAVFLKRHQIDALFLSQCTNTKNEYLDAKIKDRWNEVIGRKPNEEDEQFIDSLLNANPYKTYGMVNDKGIDNIETFNNKYILIDLLRKIWFYLFVAENYPNLNIDLLTKAIKSNEKKDAENNYKKEDDKYSPLTMLSSIQTYEDRIAELGKMIESKYIGELYDSYDSLLDALEGYDYDRFSELRFIYDTDLKNVLPLKDKDNKKTNLENINESKEMIDEKNDKNSSTRNDDVIAPQKQESKEQQKQINEIDFIKEKTFDNALKKAEDLLAEYGTYSNANLCWNMFKTYIEETDKTINALKNELKSQKELFQCEEVRLKQANEILENKIKTQEFDMEAIKRKSIEDFILKLNSEENGCVLDLLYDIKANLEVDADVMKHISTIFFNVLKKQGYYLVTEEVGKEVSKSVEELVKDYRWNSDEDISNKKLVVQEPGLIVKKFNRIVYKPKICVKK